MDAQQAATGQPPSAHCKAVDPTRKTAPLPTPRRIAHAAAPIPVPVNRESRTSHSAQRKKYRRTIRRRTAALASPRPCDCVGTAAGRGCQAPAPPGITRRFRRKRPRPAAGEARLHSSQPTYCAPRRNRYTRPSYLAPAPPAWHQCRCGGIGRRGRLKICFWQQSGGSIPSTGTTASLYSRRSVHPQRWRAAAPTQHTRRRVFTGQDHPAPRAVSGLDMPLAQRVARHRPDARRNACAGAGLRAPAIEGLAVQPRLRHGAQA
jgi:hypothetical protein